MKDMRLGEISQENLAHEIKNPSYPNSIESIDRIKEKYTKQIDEQ